MIPAPTNHLWQLEWRGPMACAVFDCAGHGPAPLVTVEQITKPFAVDAPPTPSTTGHIDWSPECKFLAILWLRIRNAIRASKPLYCGAGWQPAADWGCPLGPAGRQRLSLPRKLRTIPAEIRLSQALLEPGAVGLFHPILLLPESIVERLTPSQLNAVPALTASLHMMVSALHPLAWLNRAKKFLLLAAGMAAVLSPIVIGIVMGLGPGARSPCSVNRAAIANYFRAKIRCGLYQTLRAGRRGRKGPEHRRKLSWQIERELRYGIEPHPPGLRRVRGWPPELSVVSPH